MSAPRLFTHAIAKRRHAEQGYRNMVAKSRAERVLRERYPDEYRRLYLREKRKVYRERGPLPGDAT